jgi:hypothetical protein
MKMLWHKYNLLKNLLDLQLGRELFADVGRKVFIASLFARGREPSS